MQKEIETNDFDLSYNGSVFGFNRSVSYSPWHHVFSILPLPLLLIVRTSCYPVELARVTPQLHRHTHRALARRVVARSVASARCSVAPPPLGGLPTATSPPLRAGGDKVERECVSGVLWAFRLVN